MYVPDSGEVYSLFLYDCDGADFQLEENAILAPLDNPHPVWDMKLLVGYTFHVCINNTNI